MTDTRRLFDPPSQDDLDYIPDPLGRLGMGSYEEKPPRFVDTGWEEARKDWMSGAPLPQIVGNDPFSLYQGVGHARPNRRADVFKLQALLHKEGHLDADATGGPTSYWGGRDDTALRSFQTENGLAVDGYAEPDGETINTMRGFYTSAKPKQDVQAGGLEPVPPGVKAPPVPEHKREFFARPENQGAWQGFHQGLRKELPDDPDLHGILGRLYAEEGGRAVDPQTKATGGFLPGTLADMYKRGLLPDLPPGLQPKDLTPAQQAYAHRQYFDDVLHTVGGAKALSKLGDAEAAYALAEAMLMDGRGDGVRRLQQAVNRTARRVGTDLKVAEDGQMGPETIAAYRALIGRDGARDAVLQTLADIRSGERSPSELERINRTRPQQPML